MGLIYPLSIFLLIHFEDDALSMRFQSLMTTTISFSKLYPILKDFLLQLEQSNQKKKTGNIRKQVTIE